MTWRDRSRLLSGGHRQRVSDDRLGSCRHEAHAPTRRGPAVRLPACERDADRGQRFQVELVGRLPRNQRVDAGDLRDYRVLEQTDNHES